jgi:imidazolonepropionase-like amidohydrolase
VRIAVATSIAVTLAAGCGSDAPPRSGTLVTADRVFDGTRVLHDAGVLVRGGRVVEVGRVRGRPLRTFALGDATILPGLVDLHVHVPGDRLTARNGLMTVRDVGIPEAVLRPPFEPRGGPRTFEAGPLITVPRGYVSSSSVGLVVTSPATARAAVRRLVKEGAALIKIALENGGVVGRFTPMLTLAEVRAIVDEAHGRGRIVTAHVLEQDGVDRALAGGVDELTHMPCLGVSASSMRELARRRIPIVGTLHVARTVHAAFPSAFSCPDAVANARIFVAAGGTLLYGTDMGNPGIPDDVDVDELVLMRRAGLTPVQVLRAATAAAADELRRPRLVRLASGSPADLWAVRGDATADLRRLAHPVLAIVRGGIVRQP